MDVVHVNLLRTVLFLSDELIIKIINLFSDHMLVYWGPGVIYKDEISELTKFVLQSVVCLDAFDLHGDYYIGETIFGCC